MGLLDTLRRLLRSSPSDDSVENPAERATPTADPDRMYATAPSDDDGDQPDRDPVEPEQPSTPPELFAQEAEECADFWSDYDLDFTTDSLARLDDAVDERFESHRFVGVEPDSDGSADARAFERVVRSFGSYCGETLVRDAGWEWVENGDWHVTDGDETLDPFAVATGVFRSETTFTSVLD
ncbi:hypothetical protein [Haloarchaeobius iranensis]|uniref:Uncharacterized protein n=1 Tax=Haloarchaeobius iranensis TaxID=996166 RepID=A0A1H0AGE8_9EURY|nr:hypothetical protein [Haloarchaeobius iranensis]SDN32515.1 hypothetical protein SAMN05192554_1278 [Haloarchaeobius iranensis]